MQMQSRMFYINYISLVSIHFIAVHINSISSSKVMAQSEHCFPACIVQGCRKRGKPVIVATNMLESMITNPTPTRAEVSDIAIAVREGTDAVMLSGETAYGKFPFKSVAVMATVAKRTEKAMLTYQVSSYAALRCSQSQRFGLLTLYDYTVGIFTTIQKLWLVA